MMSSLRYRGAVPWRHWWDRREILNWILCWTGSQWRDLRMGVMWWYFRTPIRILAILDVLQPLDFLSGDPDECVAVVQPGGDKGVDKFFGIGESEYGAEFCNVPE